MSKRYVVLALAAVLALAVSVPAFAGSEATTSASAKKIAKKALKKAKKAKKLAQQALNENDAQDTSITNIEQQLAAGGGGTGPAGPQGPAGPPGPAGTAAGATFSLTLDGNSSNVSAGGFSLTFSADNAGVCDHPELQSRADSWFWESNQTGAVQDGDLDADEEINVDDPETGVVTARTNSGTARAQWEFGLSNNVDGDCFVAGTVLGT
jgi:hypothetical protein